MGHYNSNDKKEEVNPNCVSSNDIADSVQLIGDNYGDWIERLVERRIIRKGDKVRIPGTRITFTYEGEADFSKKGPVTYEERFLMDHL